MKRKTILKKTLLGLVSLVVVLVVLLTATFLFWLGPTVKILAEKIGSKALGAPVSIENLSINPRKGTLLLTGFEIGNHAVFGQSNTVSLAAASIAIDMETVFSDTIVVEEILIDSPHFVYEQNSSTDNITEYIANIFAFAKFDPNELREADPEPETDAADEPEKEPKKVVVNKLKITDVKMSLANTDDPDLDIHVGMEELTLSMSNGVFRLHQLTLSDPGLLNTPNLFVLETVEIDIDPNSIYSETLIIENIHVTKPYAYFEQNTETDTLSECMRIADSFTSRKANTPPPADGKSEAPEPKPEIDEDAPPPVELHQLVIDDIQMHIVNMADPKLDVRFRLEQLALSPTSGVVQLTHLTASNPKRLETPNVFELETIKIQIDPASLTSGTVVIEDVQVAKPYAFLEQNPETDTLSEFMRIADSFTSKTATAPAPPGEQPEIPEPETEVDAGDPAPPPVVLHNLYIDDIQIKLLDTTGTNATHETQTLASIGDTSVKLVEGKIRIAGITVPNPAGFTATNLFHLANIDITIDPDSVYSPHVIINEVFVNSPLVNLEQTESTGNVAELQKTLGIFIPSAPEAPAEPEPVAMAEEKPEPTPLAEQPVLLETLLVTNLVVNMILPSETNTLSIGSRSMKQLDKLNPMGLLGGGGDTNAPAAEVASVDNGSRTLLAFELLTVQPLKGLIQIDNLRVGNPKGFANPNLVSVEHFRIDIKPDSMQTDTLLIKDILIKNPRVAYERQLSTDNIKAFQASIAVAFERRDDSMGKVDPEEEPSAEPGAAPTKETAAEGQKVIIEHLLVQSGMVRAKISALPTAPIPLPKIEMVDVGKKEGGAKLGDAMSQIYGTFYDAIIGSVSSVTGFAGDALKGAGTLTFGALGTVTGGRTDNLGGRLGLTEQPEEEKKPKKRLRLPGRRF